MFQGMLTTKQALTEIGYLDEQLRSWQEWDTSIRLAEICDFVFVDKALFLYHHDDRSAISANLYADLQGYLHVIIKHRRAILHYLSQAGWDAHLQSLISRSLGMNLPGFARYLVRSQPLPFSRKVVLMLSIHLRLLHGRLGCLRPIAGSFGRLW